MRLHKLCAVLLSFTVTVTSLVYPSETKRVQAAERETGFVGLDVEYHTQEQIRDYYKSHPIKNMEAEFSEEPSVTMPYSPGKLTEETQQDALNMLNLYRYVTGVPTVSISETAQNYAQAAALVTAINRNVSHVADQPDGMSDELYAQAVYGTANSNLAAGGNKLCGNVLRYMLETNGDLGSFGHRRQLLDYYCEEVGFGLAKSVSDGYYSATYIGAGLKEDKIISYPGQNQPLEYFGPGYAWTVVVPESVDESTVAVKLTDTKTGKIWNFDEISEHFWISSSSRSSCIIFSPYEIDYRAGDTYKVEITGISKPVSYEVNFFLVDDPIPVESVSSNIGGLTVQVGTVSSMLCKAECSPENASNQIVKWTSADPDIAVPIWRGTGVCAVEGKKTGTVLFTGTTEDGGYKTYVEIDVVPTPESVVLSETDVTIGVGQSFELSGKVLPSAAIDTAFFNDDYDFDIIKKEDTAYSGRIKITGKAVGETSISAFSAGNRKLKEICRIKVVEPVYTENLALDQTEIEMFKNDTIKLNTIVSPSNITCKEIKWSSSNINIVEVKDGVVTYGGSNLIGEAVVTAKAMDGSGKEAKCKVTVFGKYSQMEYPWATSASSDTVTLEKVEDCEYSMDAINWQDSNVFTGLEADHEYKFYIRHKAIRYMKASDASEAALVRTTSFIAPKDCTHSHTVIRNVIETSCLECGYTGDTYCVDCRIKKSEGEITVPLGHTYKSKVTKKATYAKDGSRTYTCSNCGDSYTETILSILKGGKPEDNEEKDIEPGTTQEPGATQKQGATPEPGITPEPGATQKPGATPEPGTTQEPGATLEPKPTLQPGDGDTGGNNGSNEVDKVTDKNTDNRNENSKNKNDNFAFKKGSKFAVGICRYRIISSSAVELIGLKSNKTKKLIIPKTTKNGGKTFKVTSIADKALSKTRITHVTIGANVRQIGAGAFKNCGKLKKITIQSTKLRSVGKNAFKGIKATAKIKVPAKKLKAYKKLLKKKGQGKKVKIIK